MCSVSVALALRVCLHSYLMRALSAAQKEAGLAVNAAGAVVNKCVLLLEVVASQLPDRTTHVACDSLSRAGVVLAPAGEAAAKIAHEGAVQAARGADVAARYAKLAVSASSPYAAAALTEAQVAAGVMYNEAGKLVNAAGKFVNPAGVVLTKAAARAQGEIVKAAKIMLPMGKNALSAAQVCAPHCGGVVVLWLCAVGRTRVPHMQ